MPYATTAPSGRATIKGGRESPVAPGKSVMLARIIHDEWIMRAMPLTYLDKPVYTQKRHDLRFQTWSSFESEYVEVYRGLGGLAPKLRALETDPGQVSDL